MAAHVVVTDILPSQVVTPHAASTLAITPTWVDNMTDETITVEVVGIEKRDFAPGLYHWLTLPAGTYTVRAWAKGYSYKFKDYFYEKVTLAFN